MTATDADSSYGGGGDPVHHLVDKYRLVPELLKVRGIVETHLHSYNNFLNTDIKKIVRANDHLVSAHNPNIYIRFKDVEIGRPSYREGDVRYDREVITPQMCRLSGLTYSVPIYGDIEYTTLGRHFGEIITRERKIVIGRVPIMLRSCCCVLYGKDEAQLARFGECPLDPGGYFIIKGAEKVLLIQEHISHNHVFVDRDEKNNIKASVTSEKSKTVIQMEKGEVYLILNQFVKKIPIMVVLKAMGMESDQEVVQMLGRDPRFSALIIPSIEKCASLNISTQEKALEYLDRKVKKSDTSNQEGRGLAILRDVFLAHVPVSNNNFRPKCLYVGVMLRRMMEAMLNKEAMDDKDYVGNKRLELSGQLLSLLFEDLFLLMINQSQKKLDIALKNRRVNQFDPISSIQTNIIFEGLERTLSTGNFDVKRFKMHRKGMTQVLQRQSFIASLGHMTRISPQFGKFMKVGGPRALQPSQWGMLCPCDTPVGEACGLVKHLALMTHVTTDEEGGPLILLCYALGVEDLEILSAEELHTPKSFLIVFNELILGKHRRPQHFANELRKLRRGGKIGEFVSIFVNEKQRCVYIASDGGRVCRPLVIADKGISRIKEHHMKELSDGDHTFDDFLCDGLIEYLDVNEENNALIAEHEGKATPEATHIEIEPFTMLGVCAGLIPYPHHNQSTRNTYQCAMGKQAMGNIAYNQLCRMDSFLNLLVYPQRPLLTTRTIELVGYDKLGAGQNATVAVMSYSGYDMEDAIVMNKSSLDHGFGRCIVMKKKSIIYKSKASDKMLRPDRTGPDAEKMQILDDDGFAAPGEIIRPKDMYCMPTKSTYNGPKGETCVVDRVALCSAPSDKGDNDEGVNHCIKLIIRHTRRPEVGDKFSSRHGQKGVCGAIIQQEDFPFSERGICPDLIMNPHGFPSGMTIGKLIELLGGKAGVSCGRFHYGTAFGEPSGHADRVEVISETLVKHGFSYSGKDFMYSGIMGSALAAYIFMGPIYYQKQRHMVQDKMHARGSGPRNLLTRQPTEGKARNGGQRIGEMERDCLISYGASMLIFERMMLSSDYYEVQVCGVCGLLGYYNHKLKVGVCSTCKSADNVNTMKLPYACKLLFQELQSMNIVPHLKLADA